MELEAKFATEEACRMYLAGLRWPGGVSLSTLQSRESLAGGRTVGVRQVWTADLGHGRDYFPRHPHTVAGLVSCHVVGDDAEERGQCVGAATGTGAEKVRDRLNHAA
jgi:hypothetical protein